MRDSLTFLLLALATLSIIIQESGAKDDGKDVDCASIKELCECRKQNKCRWRDRECKKHDDACSDLTFTEKECRRELGLYAFAGSLCFTKEKSGGNCAPIEVPLSVNCGGDRYTDFEGATYEAAGTVPFEDPLSISEVGEIPDDQVKGAKDFDKAMYRSYRYGTWDKPAESDSTMCLHFKIPIIEPGEYEVTVRMLDPESEAPGERSFNMKLNKRSVIREIDLFALAKKKSYAVNVRMIFRVTNDLKTVVTKGHKDTKLMGKEPNFHIPVSFCNSDCKDQKNVNFIISAVRVMQYSDDGGEASPGGGDSVDDDDDAERAKGGKGAKNCKKGKKGGKKGDAKDKKADAGAKKGTTKKPKRR